MDETTVKSGNRAAACETTQTSISHPQKESAIADSFSHPENRGSVKKGRMKYSTQPAAPAPPPAGGIPPPIGGIPPPPIGGIPSPVGILRLRLRCSSII